MFEPTPVACILLVAAGVASGGVNAIAGGGSLISFPTMTALGVPPIVANATNALAQVPGSFSAALGFRKHLPEVQQYVRPLAVPTFVGGALGGILLLSTSEKLFNYLVPVLILVATLLLALQPKIRAWAKRTERHLNWSSGYVLQFLISVYGGYFGAGMGILMLAYLGLVIHADIHQLNTLKSWLAVIINLFAGFIFLKQGVISWVPLLCVMSGSIVGGAVFSRLSQRVEADKLRLVVVGLGLVMFVWFAWKAVQ